MSWTVALGISSYPSATISNVSVNSGDLVCIDFSYQNTNQSPTCSDTAAGGTNSYTEQKNGGNSGGSTTCFGHSFSAKAKASEVLTVTCTTESDNGIHATVARATNGISATPLDGTAVATSEAASGTNHVAATTTISAASAYIHVFWFEETGNALLTDVGGNYTKESEQGTHVSASFDRKITVAGSYAQTCSSDAATFYNSITVGYAELAGAAGDTSTSFLNFLF